MSRSTAGLPADTRLGRTALRVADLPNVVSFYRDVVGLGLVDRSADVATLGVDGTPLLVLYEDESAKPRRRMGAGLYHNAFRVPSREALGDALDRIRTDWQLSGASDHGFSEALYLSDPEGNGVEVYRDRARDDWPRADGTLQAPTRPLDLESLATAGTDDAGDLPPETTLGHVHLESSSVAAARSFYADALGFAVTIDLAPSALFFAAGGYHHHVAVNAWHGRSNPMHGRGLAWFELLVPDDAALAALRRRLADAAVRDLETGIEVRDPDEIPVRIRPANGGSTHPT